MTKRSYEYAQATENGIQPSQVIDTKIYKRRWLILFIFVLYSASNSMQWTEYTIIGSIIQKYYKVPENWVNMTSLIYMITYIPLVFPASYFLDKFGLRNSVIIGALGTTIGSWIKVFSVNPDKYWLTFLGQTIVAISQTFILSVPPRLASVWFGPDQVSSACSTGVFGNQLGIAMGFIFPPILVPSSDDVDVIARGLSLMFYIAAVITLVIFILILLFFKEQPPLPPSVNQAVRREAELTQDFLNSIKRLMSNTGYLLLLVTYSINLGVFYALCTVLERIVVYHFPGRTTDAGAIGLTIVCLGMIGSIICGLILDKTRKFKETTLVVYILSFVGMVVFTFTLGLKNIVVVYLTAGLLGFFMTGYLPIGFEFAAELTYPEPEFTSSGLLNAMLQIFGIAFTFIYSYLFDLWNDLIANLALCAALLVGAVITAIIPNDLRRQKAKV